MTGSISPRALIGRSRRHLADAGEGYGRHCLFAAGIALRLLGAGAAVFIHAFIPVLFENTGSKAVQSLHDTLQGRKNARQHEGA